MKLLVQPEDAAAPVLTAIRKARKTIDLYVFRLGHKAIEEALEGAVARGVVVRTLIANTASGGEKVLRKLEQRLLQMGATVSRTADDLIRYHGKMMVVDGSTLYLFAFNLVKRDIEKSRSLGLVMRRRDLVREAMRLFQADFDRKPYSPACKDLVVSPINARARLALFLRRARKQLLIYDSGLTDNAMIRILRDRLEAGVDVRIIGKMEKGHSPLSAQNCPGKRQHLRAIVRDGRFAFLGSQSLRKLELESRREIGVLIKSRKVVSRIVEIFEADWAATEAGAKAVKKQAAKAVKKLEEVKKAKERRAA
jgi:phosphatidylserine/phosphatidylglycerophosphate/cardiolipin synthase-like enzyme